MPQNRFEGIQHTLQSARNRLGFSLRGFLKGYGPPYKEPAEAKNALFDGIEAQHRLRHLNQQYGLQPLTQNASVSRYRETLTYLDWLDCFYRSAPDSFNRSLASEPVPAWLDVGAKNWSYVEALTSFLQTQQPQAFELYGLEIDPNRRYADLRTRRQYAETYLQNLPQGVRPHVHYQAGDVLAWQEPVNIISHFLPFVFKEPHLDWGLPLPLFQPQAVLAQELERLHPQGLLLIVNQGEAEAEAQQTLLEEAAQIWPMTFQSLGQLPVRFIQYRYPRYGWLCIKHGS